MTDKKPAWGDEKLEGPIEFARVTSLGALEKAWVKPTPNTRAGGYAFAIIGAIMWVVGGVMWAASGSAIGFLPFGTMGMIFLPIGLISMRLPRGTAKIAATFNEGFAALVGSEMRLFPWDEIKTIVTKTNIRGGSNRGGNIENPWVEIIKQSGDTVVLLDIMICDSSKLIAVIKDRVAQRLLPPLQKSYDAGETLTFGAVRVSNKVLESDKHRLDWGGVRNVVVTDGKLTVNPKEGEPFQIRVSLIPNVDLLCALIGVSYKQSDLAYRW